MKAYYDTGILLKLYTGELGSVEVCALVIDRKEPLFLSSLHVAECTSAFRLKQFRGECEPERAAQAFAQLEQDFHDGVLKMLPVDWEKAWQRCRALCDAHAGETGCRTLDSLHVACALLESTAEFITSDHRQAALAKRAGLRVFNPLPSK